MVLKNLRCEIDDVNEPWTWFDNHFDYIHIQGLASCIKDWPRLYKDAFRCFKPDEWLKHMEPDVRFRSKDGSLLEGHPWSTWFNILRNVGARTGRTFDITDRSHLVECMKKTEFGEPNIQIVEVHVGLRRRFWWRLFDKMTDIWQRFRKKHKQPGEDLERFLL